MGKLQERKTVRLKNYDYSSNGAYFVTICTKDMECILSIVGETCGLPPSVELTEYGIIVENEIEQFNNTYQGVRIDKYVIMPNHIHMLIIIDNISGRPQVSPTLSRTIQQFKGAITKKIGTSVWQRSYYDHVIRDANDLCYHLQYIDENPKKWIMGKDEYYS